MAEMNGQVALVTGGIRGIGLAICERLMNRGIKVIDEVLDQHGHLDILVNNAGITVDKTVRRMTPAEWDHVIHVNLSGAFYLSRAVLQHMLDRGYGRIINISSVIGSAGGFGQANYAAAKSGSVRADDEPSPGDRE
jgi:NAD(P)-dependent dehydrogenase (short-subunit alcohol dehydrogenase family)